MYHLVPLSRLFPILKNTLIDSSVGIQNETHLSMPGTLIEAKYNSEGTIMYINTVRKNCYK